MSEPSDTPTRRLVSPLARLTDSLHRLGDF
jgi:hypothetical protein